MNPVSHRARSGLRISPEGYMSQRDEMGRLGFTKIHAKGHLITPAAISNVLKHAAEWRNLPEHHAIYIDRVRKLIKRGTWL